MPSVFVAILMGSDSDLPVMQACSDLLDNFGIRYEVRITSAHRTPEDTRDYVREAEKRGCAVFIAAAGLAAHLAGAVAAQTVASLSPGVYFLRLEAPGVSAAQRVVVLD